MYFLSKCLQHPAAPSLWSKDFLKVIMQVFKNNCCCKLLTFFWQGLRCKFFEKSLLCKAFVFARGHLQVFQWCFASFFSTIFKFFLQGKFLEVFCWQGLLFTSLCLQVCPASFLCKVFLQCAFHFRKSFLFFVHSFARFFLCKLLLECFSLFLACFFFRFCNAFLQYLFASSELHPDGEWH